VFFRQYATLYFVMIFDSNENQLALLDLIHVFVELLDKLFLNVCELDVLYNPETVIFNAFFELLG
jgi:AP-3 complex subunit sigma